MVNKPVGYVNNEEKIKNDDSDDEEGKNIITYDMSNKIEDPKYGSCFIIRMIKAKRKELIEKEKNKEESDEDENKGKLTQNFNVSETENQAINMTFTEKMNNMITKERANIMKIKQKQKQNIEFMIEQQMKAELINYRNLEKDRRVKENKERKRKEFHDKSLKNQRIQEEMKIKRINNVEEMMKKRKDKIETKHDRIDKKVNDMNEEKNKKREELIEKRTQDLIKIYNHRSQLDIFRQEQEKKLLQQYLLEANNQHFSYIILGIIP